MTAASATTTTASNNGVPTAMSAPSPEATLAEPQQNTANAPTPDPGPRRMPDYVRKHLITLRDGQHYLPSAFRVLWFRQDHPEWSIVTELIEGGFEAGWATVRASIISEDGRVIATGMKTESKSDFPAGWVEKAETGAVGRALAMAGYGTQFAPELSEGVAAARHVGGRTAQIRPQPRAVHSAPQPVKTWQGPGLCPNCNAPEGKPHSRTCSDPQ